MTDVISRKAAISAGLVHYFTGKPCKYGHLSVRFVTSFGCKECVDIRRQADIPGMVARTASWRRRNPDKYLKQARTWRAKNRTKVVGYARKWQKKNPEKVALNKERWNNDNVVRIRAKGTVWRLLNEQKVRVTHNRRAARKAASEGSFSANDIAGLLLTQGGLCAAPHCKQTITIKYSVDHKIPLSRGGSNWPDNIQLLCSSCNSSKRDRTMEEWLATPGIRKRLLLCEAA